MDRVLRNIEFNLSVLHVAENRKQTDLVKKEHAMRCSKVDGENHFPNALPIYIFVEDGFVESGVLIVPLLRTRVRTTCTRPPA